MSGTPDLLIVGGGMAGLSCALACTRLGLDWSLVEASDRVGGRVGTDVVEGYRLDRGFQVFLSAYPEARGALDAQALQLRAFAPGADVFRGGRWRRIANPLRRPISAALGMLGGAVGPGDALRLLPVARRASRGAVRPIEPELKGAAVPGEGADPLVREASAKVPLAPTAADALREWGVSAGLTESFFRPFFGGVFLDRSLAADRRAFEFRMAMFARGDAVVPARGMGEIPAHMLAQLDASRVHLGCAVAEAVRAGDGWQVRMVDGRVRSARAIAMATDADVAHRLVPGVPARAWCETATLHYAIPAAGAPARCRSPWLMLDGEGAGPVNHAAAMSAVSRDYAPEGRALLSASVVDPAALALEPDALDAAVRAQLSRWFDGHATRAWRLLRADRIRHALPRQHPHDIASRPAADRGGGLLVCGDHVGDASINGAMRSGRVAAEAAHARLRR